MLLQALDPRLELADLRVVSLAECGEEAGRALATATAG
jgi:hypothetical protein